VQQPQAGPAGGVAEEGTTVTADGSSMRVTAPEDRQWDKRWRTAVLKSLTLCGPTLMDESMSWFLDKKKKKKLKY
jgi:hypothetical protein